jgi:hypothetical protein
MIAGIFGHLALKLELLRKKKRNSLDDRTSLRTHASDSGQVKHHPELEQD